MFPRRAIEFVFVAALAALTGACLSAGLGAAAALAAPPPPPSQEQGDVLNRGPVHEAFAEPVNVQVQAPLVVNKEPPAAIEEDPPAQRPEGDHFVWIPGYWAWDADRSDFLWVSACWRAAPPNRVWVPGYWAAITEERAKSRGGVSVSVGGVVNVQVGGGRPRTEEVVVGWEWIPGFWAPAGTQEIEYLPAPPAPEEIDPPGAPPQADVVWVPGCWYWRDGRYVHRPGYWLREQADWVWAPSHYIWTPRGYIFCEGHWDYSLDRRGVLFAPVYFPRSVYSRRGFRYSPAVVIDLGALSVSLFTDPRYGHYYFGDYYDDAYVQAGIYPAFECERNHSWYDPIYEHERWRGIRADPKWYEHQQQEFDRRHADKDLRPPRTYNELQAKLPRLSEAQRKNVEFAHPLAAVVSDKNTTMKFGQVSADEKQKIVNQAEDLHKFRQERSRLEGTVNPNLKTGNAPTGTPPSGTPPPSPSPRGTFVTPSPSPSPAGTPPPPPPRGLFVTPSPSPSPAGTPPPSPPPTITPTVRGPAYVPPPDLHVTESEKVKITPPPTILVKPAGPAAGDKGTPPPPPDELKRRDQVDKKGG
jgi:hypothetical protein